ncbi:MAG: succinyl-diaminopimelate desuccinylase [Acetobacteraceae bacterium]|jgi:succinyl-diaminopimelate desuccinylase|nr:succinyl-diaminopimelate desuccinylase [Rhodopila sp.]MEA2726913.1 succinyl-diaminopimelate desuccinylase [Acetobacteraceae bacterium]MEA2770862.1 succinyl-diaminopimelate desuccinylase [Acetobacteraceae bacterium]
MAGSSPATGLTDPLPLAQSLIRCASVTPADAGAQDALAHMLGGLGFTVHRLRYGEIENIFARLGTEGPHICFAGHTDVVPAGAMNWRTDPFGGEVRDGVLYGRGACDMKGAIAAFVSGAAQHLENATSKGSISFLITGDEEGPATDGTVKVLEWMRANDQIPDFCLVGEPTCPVRLGDMVKIGRRGSVNMKIEVHGTQGHVAYPHRADNPVHRLIQVLDALTSAPVDAGTDWFEPSTLQVTSIDVGNDVTNVIPGSARAALNIRFNDGHSGASLTAWVRATLSKYVERFDLNSSISGESFVTKPGPLVDILRNAIKSATGIDPKLDTGGGTSDARFISNYCPVAEFGLVGATMHRTDERVPVAELRDLARIYRNVIAAFLA